MLQNNQLKTLVFDIETFPLTVYVFERKDQFIGLNQIVHDWSVASWAAKFLNDPPSKMMYDDCSKEKNPRDDSKILRSIWKLLDQADIVVTQNGERFDARKLNARFIMAGMGRPKPFRHIDTYKELKRIAEFTSHSLEYLTDKLNVKYKKLSHGDFPGIKLWDECLKGNPKAWASMKKYNIHDVLSTEELYLGVRAWTSPNSPKPFRVEDPLKQCSTCGECGQMERRGYSYTSTLRKVRMRCKKCGTWQLGGTA